MKSLVFLLVAVGAMAFSPVVDPNHPLADGKTYASFKGSRQGVFKGNSGRERDGWFVIESWSWGVKRPHGPITIRKQVDASSPLLLEALNTGEKLEVTIQVLDAGDKVVHNLILKNAVVKGIHKDDWENVTFEYTDTVEQP